MTHEPQPDNTEILDDTEAQEKPWAKARREYEAKPRKLMPWDKVATTNDGAAS